MDVVSRALDREHYERLRLGFDGFLHTHYQFGLDPHRPVCENYLSGMCSLGQACPERHPPQIFAHGKQGSVVCKHWLRGLCKKGQHCEFLHEYNLRKMPPCHHFQLRGWCNAGEECLYLHIDPNQRHGVCPDYEAGFCPLGATCRHRHIRKILCPLFLTGFCPNGPTCSDAHPKFNPDTVKRVENVDPKQDTH